MGVTSMKGDMPGFMLDYFLQMKQQNLSVETVITAATTHWFDKKSDDLTKGRGIHLIVFLAQKMLINIM